MTAGPGVVLRPWGLAGTGAAAAVRAKPHAGQAIIVLPPVAGYRLAGNRTCLIASWHAPSPDRQPVPAAARRASSQAEHGGRTQ